MVTKIICFSLISSILFTACSQSKKIITKNNHFAEIDHYLQTQVDTARISPLAGIALAIVKGQRLVHVKAYGLKNLTTRQILQPKHNFHVASVSKTISAAAIMQLMDKGKVELDEKLITYLPYFRLADERYKSITLKQVLNHTSGMPDVEDYEWDKGRDDDGSAERWTRSLSSTKLLFTPGTKFHYSNMAYDLLADVVRKVSGTTFEKYVKYNILNKMGMNTSSFLISDISHFLRTSPHTCVPLAVSKVYPYNRMHSASSTLNSNVVDLSHWIMANLNGGIYKGKPVISMHSMALMHTPSFTIDSVENRKIGLSWFIMSYQGHVVLYHNGADDGYVSTIHIIPDLNIGFVLLFNSDQVNSLEITDYILNRLLAIYSKDCVKEPH